MKRALGGKGTLTVLLGLAAMAGSPGIPSAEANPARAGGDTRTLGAARALAERLESSGHAEARLERSVFDPIDGKRRVVRGRLSLEPPDRAALFFPATGERVTLRGDGGEWVQPRLRQMLVLGPERAAAARRWWELLIREHDDRFSAHSLGPNLLVVTARAADGAPVDSAWVTLDRVGLPSRLEIEEGSDGRTAYRFTNWVFGRARGRAAFVLVAPNGYEVIRVP